MPREDQRSVHDWCAQHYPGETAAQKLLNLVEEVVELGCVLGVPIADVLRTARLTAAKSDDPVGDPGCTRKEVGDVLLSLFSIAESAQVDAHAALDDVMLGNRARTVAESRARSERKLAMGIRPGDCPFDFGSPCADDLRGLGGMVAVHNDYRLGGQPFTFWQVSFPRGPERQCSGKRHLVSLVGEGRTDAEALDAVRRQCPEIGVGPAP